MTVVVPERGTEAVDWNETGPVPLVRSLMEREVRVTVDIPVLRTERVRILGFDWPEAVEMV